MGYVLFDPVSYLNQIKLLATREEIDDKKICLVDTGTIITPPVYFYVQGMSTLQPFRWSYFNQAIDEKRNGENSYEQHSALFTNLKLFYNGFAELFSTRSFAITNSIATELQPDFYGKTSRIGINGYPDEIQKRSIENILATTLGIRERIDEVTSSNAAFFNELYAEIHPLYEEVLRFVKKTVNGVATGNDDRILSEAITFSSYTNTHINLLTHDFDFQLLIGKIKRTGLICLSDRKFSIDLYRIHASKSPSSRPVVQFETSLTHKTMRNRLKVCTPQDGFLNA